MIASWFGYCLLMRADTHIFLPVIKLNLSNLRPDFTSKLVHVLAFGTPKFYIEPYDKTKHELLI